MKELSSAILVGVGGAGCAMARRAAASFRGKIRCICTDTDASSAREGEAFVLLGGDRLCGRGSGGDSVQARLAAEDSLKSFDEPAEGARLAIILAAAGGGTGGGATVEIARYLESRGVPCLVFATQPFSFEGGERARRARGASALIEAEASAAVFMPLDKLAGRRDEAMPGAMEAAAEAVSAAVALFWRLVATPGYITLDIERLRRIIGGAGRGRFAVVAAEGEGRAQSAVESLASSALLANAAAPAKSILCGVLAGDDLRLSEVGIVAEGVRDAFGRRAAFDLATVNDEENFGGRISVVLLIFESAPDGAAADAAAGLDVRQPGSRKAAKKPRNPLSQGPQGRGRFNNVEPTVWEGEDLDIPAFIRRGVGLDI